MRRVFHGLLALALVPVAGAQQAATAFRPGDRVLLSVEGEPALSDTFTVDSRLRLTLPAVGEIPLEGIPRPDIQGYLATTLGRYLREPVVTARALVRIAIAGEVLRPGFYAVPTDLVLSDAIMVAGGATADAVLRDMRVERGHQQLLSAKALGDAVSRGYTLDQIGLEAGDRIVVPRRSGGIERLLPVLLAVPAAIYALVQLF
jgi:protein involved in polysaccharide export with SLBB domain